MLKALFIQLCLLCTSSYRHLVASYSSYLLSYGLDGRKALQIDYSRAAGLPTKPCSNICLACASFCFSSPSLALAYLCLHLFRIRRSGPERHAQGC